MRGRRSSRRSNDRRPAAPFRALLSRLGLGRVLLTIGLGIVAAGLALALTAATLMRRANPDMAARLMPIDGLALAYRAERLLGQDPLHPSAEVAELAREALRRQPINPTALRVLGIVAITRGDERKGRALILQAERQSRRDGPTQFWLIEDAVQRGDVRVALIHYDIVLRNKPSSHTLLFPILLEALNDPAIRGALGRYFATDEIWAPQFASYALANSKNLDALVALTVESGGLGNPRLAQEQAVGLIARLIAERRFAAARRIYLTMPGASPARLVDPALDVADLDARYGAIGWQTRAEADASSSLAKDEAGRLSLLLSANALTTANVATKLLYLQPGTYRLGITLSRFEGGDGAAVEAQIRCPGQTGDRAIWSQRASARTIRGDVVLPPGCDAQYLDIVVSGGSSGSLLDATVRSVAIQRR